MLVFTGDNEMGVSSGCKQIYQQVHLDTKGRTLFVNL